MKHIIDIFIVCLMVLLLTGCMGASYFAEYYRPNIKQNFPKTSISELYGLNQQNIDNLLAAGYVKIGESSFSDYSVDENEAMRHGEQIGAQVVLFGARHARTVTQNDIVLPDGKGGNTTIPGYTRELYQFQALYFRKIAGRSSPAAKQEQNSQQTNTSRPVQSEPSSGIVPEVLDDLILE